MHVPGHLSSFWLKAELKVAIEVQDTWGTVGSPAPCPHTLRYTAEGERLVSSLSVPDYLAHCEVRAQPTLPLVPIISHPCLLPLIRVLQSTTSVWHLSGGPHACCGLPLLPLPAGAPG
jgi:hypothetical protein